MTRRNGFEGLEALVATRGDALLATATLLAGSRSGGEDLLQAGLERVMGQWHRIRDQPEIYLRRTIYRLAVDQWRSRRRRPALVADTLAEAAAARAAAGDPDAIETLQLRQALLQALTELPPRQRAVLVLRYWEQYSETETADLLGCSIGTVKSSASRGLARLRESTGLRLTDEPTTAATTPATNGAP